MPAKKHIISLNPQERAALEQVARSNRCSGREKLRARILLLSDTQAQAEAPEPGGQSDAAIAARLKCAALTVYKVRRRAGERGALAAIEHKAQEKRKARALDGQQEAHLVALTCSTPPAGVARWSLRLLRERWIELEVVEQVGLETLRRTLKKTS